MFTTRKKRLLYLIVYVDDVMLFGDDDEKQTILLKVQTLVQLKVTGKLEFGTTVKFLGRQLHHTGTSVKFTPLDGYVSGMLKEQEPC